MTQVLKDTMLREFKSFMLLIRLRLGLEFPTVRTSALRPSDAKSTNATQGKGAGTMPLTAPGTD